MTMRDFQTGDRVRIKARYVRRDALPIGTVGEVAYTIGSLVGVQPDAGEFTTRELQFVEARFLEPVSQSAALAR